MKIANQDEHLLTILQQNDSFITLPQDVSRLRRKAMRLGRMHSCGIKRIIIIAQFDATPFQATFVSNVTCFCKGMDMCSLGVRSGESASLVRLDIVGLVTSRL